MGLQNVRRIVLIAAIVILAGALGRWIWGLENALDLAERAERAAVQAAEAIALSRAQAVQAREATERDLATVLEARPALEARVARLRADLEAARARLGDAQEGEDRVVEVIVHEGGTHPVELVLPDCPAPQPIDVRLGFEIGRIETAGAKSVLVGSVWADLTAEGAPPRRVEEEIAADITEWWRAPDVHLPSPERSRWREWDLELEAGIGWRRSDGDLAAEARGTLLAPAIGRLARGRPLVAVELEIQDGALRDRWWGGVRWYFLGAP